MIFYSIPVRCGTDKVINIGDGYTVELTWFEAFTNSPGNLIAYHIYYSTDQDKVWDEGVKFIVIDGSLSANIKGLIPGQNYWFGIRPVEYVGPSLVNDFFISLINNNSYTLIISDLENELPLLYDNLRIYPSSILRNDIGATDLTIPLVDTTGFAVPGIIKIGVELIQYSLIDRVNNNIILTSQSQRGFDGTIAREHTIDGYDGDGYWSPDVSFFIAGENKTFDRTFFTQVRFEYPYYAFTATDGYKQILVDDLNTDLSASDDQMVNAPSYDYSGYHRDDPVLILEGACVGSYIGGEWGCIGSDGVYNIYRGRSIQDINNQNQEILLSMTARPAVLIQRVHTGIVCNCYLSSSEYQDDRCVQCYGTKFVFGYQQYFNPRRSDGRIMIRVSPADDGVKVLEAGMESELNLDAWTTTAPTLHQRDIILLFDLNDNREFMYEVGTVSRNNTVLGQEGAQHFKLVRIRKTDPAYQIRIFENTAMFPHKLNTTINGVAGTMPQHSHEIVVNEKTTSLMTINQTTAVSQGHNHPIVNGVIMSVLGHTHNIIL